MLVQVRKEDSTTGRSAHCPHSGFDLILADIPDGMPVLSISKHAKDIPSWNEYSIPLVESLFEFSDYFLHDCGGMLVFLPEVPSIRADVLSYASGYGFKVFRDWWAINDLPFTSHSNALLKVRFYVILPSFQLF